MSPKQLSRGLLSFASQIDDSAIAQSIRVSQMPFIFPHVALMPDVHTGVGSAVGTVIPTKHAVIPAAVGVDIGCGMIGVQTLVSIDELANKDLAELRRHVEAAIPLSPGNYNDDLDVLGAITADRIRGLNVLATERNIDLSHSPTWQHQLGSLGGGNHFIELCVDECGVIWLFLHSGSRGVGNKIATKHIKIAQKLCKQWWIDLPHQDLAYLPQAVPEFSCYIRELNWAQLFAAENRNEMMDRFVYVFAQWLGHTAAHADELEVERINTHHNYTRMEHHRGTDVWVTRKGAIDAHEGVRGLIPGSMGTRSYVVTGKGNPSALHSAPHGAGRAFSRNEARKRFTADDLAAAMVGIEYRHGDEWIDEIPDAYKSIDLVMEDARDLVTVDHELRQLMNVKGT